MRAAAALATLALAACGPSDTDPTPAETAQNGASAAPAAAESGRSATVSRQIGTTSPLTGQTSALTGTVSDFVVERTDTETRVQLAADTLFEFDKAVLGPAAQANLQRTAELVRQGGKGPVSVVGHTDAKGADAYNFDLSKRRAAAVIDWLKTQPGLGAQDFVAIGRGRTEPVAPNARPDGSDDPEGRAKNRRVVVVIPR